MVLVSADAESLVFNRVGRPRAAWLVAFAFVLMAVMTVALPGIATPFRVPTAIALALIALGLFALGRRQRQEVTVSLTDGVIDNGTSTLLVANARRFILRTSSPSERSPHSRYQAAVEFEGGERLVLLESSRPARALTDLRRVLDRWKLPVTLGWGLGETHAPPWVDGTSGHAPPGIDVSLRPHPRQKRSARTLAVSVMCVAAVIALLDGLRSRRGETTSAFSYALPTVALGVFALIAAMVATDRVALSIAGQTLNVSRKILGVRFTSRVTPCPGISGAWYVATSGPDLAHLVLSTDGQLLDIPVAGEDPEEMKRLAERLMGR